VGDSGTEIAVIHREPRIKEVSYAQQALLDHFSALKDPRQSWKVVYPLPEVLLCVLFATMAGAEDFVETERWANEKLDS